MKESQEYTYNPADFARPLKEHLERLKKERVTIYGLRTFNQTMPLLGEDLLNHELRERELNAKVMATRANRDGTFELSCNRGGSF